MIRNAAAAFVLAVVCSAVFPAGSFAAGADIFDAKARYDIYITGSENELTVISDVEIVRFETILDRTFLIVRPADFSLNPRDGFILFEAVQAILPNENLRFQNPGSKKIKF